MKLLGHTETVEIKNISGGRIALGKFALAHNASKVITPMDYSDDTLKSLDIFLTKGKIQVKGVKGKQEAVAVEASNVVVKESLKNDKGETHSHTVFDPDAAKRNKLVEVESIDNNSKSVSVEDLTPAQPSISKSEAEDFLAQHWKKVEKEVEAIGHPATLDFLLATAKELGMEGNKKYELIEEKIASLK